MREVAETAVLSLSGRLDLANGSALKEQLKQLLARGKTQIHLNLAEVEFINSSGLGALVSIMKEVRLIKGRLTLSNPASYVQEIFEITQLSHIFEIYSTEEEALSSFEALSARA
jgi:anti-sigma B factor antagonist